MALSPTVFFLLSMALCFCFIDGFLLVFFFFLWSAGSTKYVFFGAMLVFAFELGSFLEGEKNRGKQNKKLGCEWFSFPFLSLTREQKNTGGFCFFVFFFDLFNACMHFLSVGDAGSFTSWGGVLTGLSSRAASVFFLSGNGIPDRRSMSMLSKQASKQAGKLFFLSDFVIFYFFLGSVRCQFPGIDCLGKRRQSCR